MSDGSNVNLTSSLTGTTYTSSAPSVATVSVDGLVTAVGNGAATITARNSGKSASVNIRVSLSTLQSLSIAPSSGPVSINLLSPIFNQQLSVQGKFSDGAFEDLTSSATGTSYQSSNPGIAQVGPSGLASFTGSGNVTLTASNSSNGSGQGGGGSGSSVSAAATFQVSNFTPLPLSQIVINGANNVKVAPSGNLAYVTTGGGLTIVDASSPRNPQIKGSLNLNGNATDLAPSPVSSPPGGRGIVYVADGSGGVRVVDVSNPASPSLSGTYSTGGTVQAVAISSNGQTLYVEDNQNITIASLANPRSPTTLATLPFANGGGGLAVGEGAKTLLFAARTGRLFLVDVSAPSSPVLQGSVALAASGLAAQGNFAYVASGTDGMKVIDATNPQAPAIVGKTNIDMNAQGAASRGNLVFVAEFANNNSFVPFFNVSNPASPTLVGTLNISGTPQDTRIDAGDFLVFCGGE